jgi:YidC/Oxa1 family membrane protein insertase
MAEKKKFNIFPYIFIFLATFLLLQYIQGDKEEDPVLSTGEIGIETVKNDYAIGKDIKVELQNNTELALTLEDRCPEPYFDVYKYTSEGFEPVASETKRNCEDLETLVIEPGNKKVISLLDYSYSYFGETGRYKLELATADGKIFTTPEFEIEEPGMITKFWREVIYKPILNALVALLIYMPGHYLWLAVMVLTIIIRTILLIPSQKAMKAQKAMQEVQPKLDKIKEKYKDDQARIAQETMLIWKEHKVSPVSSCLPTLAQLPILIALFYVIRGGLSPDKAAMIYEFLPAFSLADINPAFITFDLMDRSILIFPVVIGALQFLQMHLMMSRKKDKKDDKNKKPTMASEMENATKMMKYVMPVMIAFFTAQMPAAVGLYWGTSTFYGIIQQLVVNKGGSSSPTKSKEDDVKVRVINKSHGKKG